MLDFLKSRFKYKELFVVSALFLGLSVLLTWPLALHLTETIPGSDVHVQDKFQNLWNFWWVKFSLVNLQVNPFHSGYLLYPYGADLYLHTLDLVNGLLGIPFQIFGLTFAYNTIILFALTLTGLATYLFAKEIGLTIIAAFIAGVFMTFSPAHLHFINGEVEFANFGWFILYLYLLVKLVKNAKGINWRYLVAGGVLLALIGYTSSYQLIWISVISLLWVVKESWFRRDVLKGWVINWAGSFVLGFLLLSPLLIGALLELHNGKVVAEDSYSNLVNTGNILGNFFTPPFYNPLVNIFTSKAETNSLSSDNYFYLGFSLLALAILGIFFKWHKKEKIELTFWLLVGLGFGIISLGPELRIADESTGIPLPYRLLIELPFMKIMRNSSRYAEVLLLGLALFGGYGFQKLFAEPWLNRLSKLVFASVLGLFVILEFWMLPYPLTLVEIPPAYNHIKGSGAVLELPLNKHDTTDASGMLYQTKHNRPILSAYLSRQIITPYDKVNSPLNLIVWRINSSGPDIFSRTQPENALNFLRINGVGTIALQRDQEADTAKQEDYLTQITGKPAYYKDEKTSLFEVESGPAQPVMILGSGWYDKEKGSDNQFSRWVNSTADFDVYSPRTGEVNLEFKAIAYSRQHTLQLVVNNENVETIVVPTDFTFFKLKLNLEKGYNQVILIGQEPAVSPNEVGQGNDRRKLFIQIRQVTLETVQNRG